MANKKFKFPLYLVVSVILTFGVSLSLQNLLAAWQTPTAVPPDGNTLPPIYDAYIGVNPDTNSLVNKNLGVAGQLIMTSAGSNIVLNNNWLSNDGNNEGIAIDNNGRIGIGKSNPSTALDVSGTVTATNFSGNGSGLTGLDWNAITTNMPAGFADGIDNTGGGITVETDPTVLASVKNGISWNEVSNRPAGLDDGDQVGITSETDPKVGPLANNGWCWSDGNRVLCNHNAPGQFNCYDQPVSTEPSGSTNSTWCANFYYVAGVTTIHYVEGTNFRDRYISVLKCCHF